MLTAKTRVLYGVPLPRYVLTAVCAAIMLMPAAALQTAIPQTSPPPAQQSQPVPQPTPVQPVPTHGSRRFVVVIDPGHGGSDRGAALTVALPEKDVTLTFARRIRTALETRGVTVLLLRDSDATLSLEQRALAVNAARPALFLSIHAAAEGNGVRLYTAQLQPPSGPAATFLPWSRAQSAFLPQSRRALDAVAHELTNAQIPVASLAVSMRPLNNAASPAIVIELAPSSKKVESVSSAAYQTLLANAVGSGVESLLDSLERPQ